MVLLRIMIFIIDDAAHKNNAEPLDSPTNIYYNIIYKQGDLLITAVS